MDTLNQWTFKEHEEEVLLFPYFTFQVMSQEKYENVTDERYDGISEIILITLVEIPFQNILRLREVHSLSVIWCQCNEMEGEFDCLNDGEIFAQNVYKQKNRDYNFEIAKTHEEAIHFIKKSVRAILIVVPKFASSFLPKFFGGELKQP